MSRLSGFLAVVLLLLLAASPGWAEIRLSDRLADVSVENGNVVIDGETLTADEFVAAIEATQGGREGRGWLFTVLDVTGPLGVLWVSLGLLGQLLFTGRMVVQWLASEKQKQSVVPPVFWWMSFFGATLLLSYFIWRTDVVGILGQSTGFGIYARNLWLIYKPKV
jgi:lipid-A-disaccharide synthase-like uncharacterized protein